MIKLTTYMYHSSVLGLKPIYNIILQWCLPDFETCDLEIDFYVVNNEKQDKETPVRLD